MEINLKLTISFLLPAAFMLLLLACGDTQPLPDIDATVEARVELAKASLVASTVLPTYTPAPEVVVKEMPAEAKAQVMAKSMVEAAARKVPATTPIPPGSAPAPVPNMFTDSSQSFGNSGSVGIAKDDLDSDGDPEQPTSQPPGPLLDKPNHPRLDSLLNKLAGQIGSRSTADIASSAPVSIGDLVGVTVRLSHNSSSTVDFLESVGAIVANIGTDYIEAYTPVTVLVSLSERDGVLRVEAIIPSEPAVTDN